jgi:hypothetical protein
MRSKRTGNLTNLLHCGDEERNKMKRRAILGVQESPSALAAAKMSNERPSFVAHPLCSPHLRRQVEDVANGFNSNWLLPPQQDEIFESAFECFWHLQAWALTRGLGEASEASRKHICKVLHWGRGC